MEIMDGENMLLSIPLNPGRRPSIGEIRAYYSSDEILTELLLAMQRWHVRFVPGYARTDWVYIHSIPILGVTVDRKDAR